VLSERQLNDFATDGYIVVPGVAPEELLAAADTEVDATLAPDPPPSGSLGPHFYFLGPLLPAADAALREFPVTLGRI
jgi:hypothetical protein